MPSSQGWRQESSAAAHRDPLAIDARHLEDYFVALQFIVTNDHQIGWCDTKSRQIKRGSSLRISHV